MAIDALCPHRGGKTKMTTGAGASKVLASGELFVEYPDTGVGSGKSKIKIGDGVTAYSSLPYALGETSTDLITYTESTATSVAQALNEAASGSSLATIVAGLKKAIQLGGGGGSVNIFTGSLDDWNALTDEEKAEYDLISNDEPGGLQEMFPSSRVGYGANSNVETELNKLNDEITDLSSFMILKESINLSSYNSSSNMYTFPKDGYLFVSSDNDASSAEFGFYNNSNQWMGSIKTKAGLNGMQVKKGTKGFCSIVNSASVKFCPFYVS